MNKCVGKTCSRHYVTRNINFQWANWKNECHWNIWENIEEYHYTKRYKDSEMNVNTTSEKKTTCFNKVSINLLQYVPKVSDFLKLQHCNRGSQLNSNLQYETSHKLFRRQRIPNRFSRIPVAKPVQDSAWRANRTLEKPAALHLCRHYLVSCISWG
jgi:hypothetical protein